MYLKKHAEGIDIEKVDPGRTDVLALVFGEVIGIGVVQVEYGVKVETTNKGLNRIRVATMFFHDKNGLVGLNVRNLGLNGVPPGTRLKQAVQFGNHSFCPIESPSHRILLKKVVLRLQKSRRDQENRVVHQVHPRGGDVHNGHIATGLKFKPMPVLNPHLCIVIVAREEFLKRDLGGSLTLANRQTR